MLVVGVKVLMSLALLFSYPLTVYPVNKTIEKYLFGDMPKTRKRQCLKNVSRLVNVTITTVFAVLLAQMLDKFVSLLGALICSPISFILPCAIHLKLGAKKGEKLSLVNKALDWFIVILGVGLMVLTM